LNSYDELMWAKDTKWDDLIRWMNNEFVMMNGRINKNPNICRFIGQSIIGGIICKLAIHLKG